MSKEGAGNSRRNGVVARRLGKARPLAAMLALILIAGLGRSSAAAPARGVSPQFSVQAVVLDDPAAAANDAFGNSVSLDGSTLVVGAPGFHDYEGAAYVYKRNRSSAGNWERVATLSNPTAASNDVFGTSVSVSGDAILVGASGAGFQAGAAYLYGRNQGGPDHWGLVATLSHPAAAIDDLFGYSVSISEDTAVVSALGVSAAQGAAYIYGRNQGGPGAWGLAATLSDPTAMAQDLFGYSVAVNGDTVVIGASGVQISRGLAHVYGRNQGGHENWGLEATLGDSTTDGDFGSSVAVSGSTVIVGSIFAEHLKGAAYIYSRQRDGVGGWKLSRRLHDPAKAMYDEFGAAVAVNGDTVVVGSAQTRGQQGVAYIYHRVLDDSRLWPKVKTLNGPPVTGIENFGNSVAVNGSTLVVGANASDGFRGRVYVYDFAKSLEQ